MEVDDCFDERPDNAPGIRIVGSGKYSQYLAACAQKGYRPEPRDNFESDLDVQDAIDALIGSS